MARASLVELSLKLAIARQRVGSIWRHKSGDLYQITAATIQESTGDVSYDYRPLTGEGADLDVVFNRPAWEWELAAEGETEPRFTLLKVIAQ
jgi:ABC-type taurine transport system ATPase subunit